MNVTVDVEAATTPFSPVFGHDLELAKVASPTSSVRHTVLNWSYPDEEDGNLFWNSRVEIGEFDGRVEFSFQLSFDSAQYLISPVDFRLRRPRIVGVLLKEFRCTCGDSELSLGPKEIGVEQIEDFVANRLLSPTRRIPIVLLSRASAFEKTLVDPNRLADRLAGIAETYFLKDKWAGFALTDSIGKIYSCYNGALRTYWPGFDPTGSSFSPIYLPERLLLIGDRVVEDLLGLFAGISAFRYVRGPVTADAIEYLHAERTRETEKLKADAKERGDLNELLELASQENEEVRKQNDALREENGLLSANLALAQENFRVISQSHGLPEGVGESGSSHTEETFTAEPKSIEEAVVAAKESFATTLVIQDSALDSARDSPFKQFSKVQQALLAMHEVCLSWRSARKKRTPMGTFETAFQGKGFEYKPRESMTAKGKWGDEYEMTYRSKRVSIEPHLALGKGGPDTCLRIHFYMDEEEGKFVVAHVGRHKTNTRS
jgi:hypothetical protein